MDFDLQACIRGDKRAWDAFVDRYAGVIVAAVSKLTRKQGSTTSAEVGDAVQEVFLRLLKDDCHLLKSFDPERASITTWLTLVARSTTIDGFRRKRLTTQTLHSVQFAAPAERNSAAGMATHESRHEIDRPTLLPPVLDTLLSPRQRLILHMLFERDMAVPDVASALGVDEQTVRSGKHKALIKLREHFGVERGE